MIFKINITTLNVVLKKGTDFVNEYCMDLTSDVQLKTEEAIQQINDISIKIIEEINAYE